MTRSRQSSSAYNGLDPQEALERAVLASDLKAISDAVNGGADVNYCKEVFEIKGPHYLVLSYPLWVAIDQRVRNLEEVLSCLISFGAKPSDYKTYELASKGSTLVKACELGGAKRNRVVQLLLDAGASPKEGRGAVLAHIDWTLGSKQENQDLKRILGMGVGPLAKKTKGLGSKRAKPAKNKDLDSRLGEIEN